jgi:hypothetical protein
MSIISFCLTERDLLDRIIVSSRIEAAALVPLAFELQFDEQVLEVLSPPRTSLSRVPHGCESRSGFRVIMKNSRSEKGILIDRCGPTKRGADHRFVTTPRFVEIAVLMRNWEN